MIKSKSNFDEKFDITMYFCFMFSIFQYDMWFDYVSNHYKGNNCTNMNFGMYFVLGFTFDFCSSCYTNLYV